MIQNEKKVYQINEELGILFDSILTDLPEGTTSNESIGK